MAFIVEDGTGKKGATSYATVAYFRAYMADRGIDVTTVLDPAIQAALIAATDYIDTRWGPRFLGSRFWTALRSRSLFTLTGQPAEGETVTVGSDVVTFRAAAVADEDVEIGTTLADTLSNLANVVMTLDSDGVLDSCFIADPDVAAMAIYVTRDGVVTSTTVANGTFDVATSTGYSGKRQPLEFPRSNLSDRDGELVSGMPEKLLMATCEYANRARTNTLAPDGAINSTIISESTSVGPISKSTTYNTGSVLNPIKAYPAADRLLQEYVRGGGIVRA